MGEIEVDVACRHWGRRIARWLWWCRFFLWIIYEQCGCGAGDLNFARATEKVLLSHEMDSQNRTIHIHTDKANNVVMPPIHKTMV